MSTAGYSTRPGFVNRKNQMNLGKTNPPRQGTDHGQSVYVMRCPQCRRNYGANGSDIWLRRCPYHQGGMPGLKLIGDEPEWRDPRGR